MRTKAKTMQEVRISEGYIDHVHGPAAEDGHPPAMTLIELAWRKNNILIDMASCGPELRKELVDGARVLLDAEAPGPYAAATARRILKTARRILKAAGVRS